MIPHGPIAMATCRRPFSPPVDLDENGLQAVGLRETARRVGVSATAAYRHFTSKEDLLASVAAEGFRDLAAAMERAARGPIPSPGGVLPISSSLTRTAASFA